MFIKLTLGEIVHTVLVSAFHSVSSALFAEREHSVCDLQHGTQTGVLLVTTLMNCPTCCERAHSLVYILSFVRY